MRPKFFFGKQQNDPSLVVFTSHWFPWVGFWVIQLFLVTDVVVSFNSLLIFENMDLADHALEELLDGHISLGIVIHDLKDILQLSTQSFLDDLLATDL